MALPERDHRMTLAAAAVLTRRFRDAKLWQVKSAAFHADQVVGLLGQPGCVGLRIHFGLEEDGSPTLVLTGMDANDGDQLDGAILQVIYPCPPFCGAANALNS